ncbi:MAG TPA: MFS transporter [Bacteroides sp.]|nr:MFS transporter [Bacteroides sp.]
MFKEQPKGLAIAFFANMGERFSFYIMMACLVFFLQARYGLAEDKAGNIYSTFYLLTYALALLGGFIADRTQKYKGTIFVGILIMLLGKILIAVPGLSYSITLIALFVIALGNGLFKGNLQAIVGQLYDKPQFAHLRDRAFSVFYMGINIGAFFAPSAANGIRNWYLKSQGYIYDADLAGLSNSYLAGRLEDSTHLQLLADKMAGAPVADLQAYTSEYIDAFSTGYNYAFGLAAIAMTISLLVYVFFHRLLPDRKKQIEENKTIVQMPWSEEKPRIIALLLVFLVVIFFWMSFHQNGLTLSFFARDYTSTHVGPVTNMFFELKSFLAIIIAIIGLVYLVRRKSKMIEKLIGAGMLLVGGALAWYFYGSYSESNRIQPEIFQQFNPIFIVFLTPLVIAVFSYWNKKGVEPSTPRKIGIGMILAASGFVIMIVGSRGLTSPADLGDMPSPDRISPYWLINTYLILTISELFLSPMGISFVSKVSPPRFQGLMQGGWLGATALGNGLLFVGSLLWIRIDLWILWSVFVLCCLMSAAFIFSIMKKLENATGNV